MAKKIQPLTIWNNGNTKVVEYLQVTCINDNYESSATNYWQLFTKVVDEEGNDKQGEQVAQGNLTIDEQDYINWGDQPAMAINTWIYNWSANKLNITII
jgi:hypothetical protein